MIWNHIGNTAWQARSRALATTILLLCSSLAACNKEPAMEMKKATFPDWHAVVDGQRINPGHPSDVPIPFEWAGYRWKIPARYMGVITNYEDGEVHTIPINAVWFEQKLVAHGAVPRAGYSGDMAVIIFLGNSRLPTTQSIIERDRQSYADPILVKDLPLRVYPRRGNPAHEGIWQAINLHDRLGTPIEFSCNFSMADIQSGKAFEPLPFPSGFCDGFVAVRPNFYVRVRFPRDQLVDSLAIIEAAMSLTESWITGE